MKDLKRAFQFILRRDVRLYQNTARSKGEHTSSLNLQHWEMVHIVCCRLVMLIISSLSDFHFNVHPSVSQAVAQNKPVVALESTIITHGMPYPHNLRYPVWRQGQNTIRCLKFSGWVLQINDKLACCFCSALQRRLRPLCEPKEPLLPRSASLKGKSVSDCHQTSLTVSLDPKAPWRCLDGICLMLSAKWGCYFWIPNRNVNYLGLLSVFTFFDITTTNIDVFWRDVLWKNNTNA